MGNSLHKTSDGDDEEVVLRGSMQKNMMRMMNDDVFKKYKVLEVLGSGSMGFVAKARIRSKEVGGSAVKKNRLSALINNRSNIAERRVVPVMYALKSIQVDRVSNVFLDELQNEIGILRTLVRDFLLDVVLEIFDIIKLTGSQIILYSGPSEYCSSLRSV
jgi:serine/threonine protein kinase